MEISGFPALFSDPVACSDYFPAHALVQVGLCPVHQYGPAPEVARNRRFTFCSASARQDRLCVLVQTPTSGAPKVSRRPIEVLVFFVGEEGKIERNHVLQMTEKVYVTWKTACFSEYSEEVLLASVPYAELCYNRQLRNQ